MRDDLEGMPRSDDEMRRTRPLAAERPALPESILGLDARCGGGACRVVYRAGWPAVRAAPMSRGDTPKRCSSLICNARGLQKH
jgi:hypothetical protein